MPPWCARRPRAAPSSSSGIRAAPTSSDSWRSVGSRCCRQRGLTCRRSSRPRSSPPRTGSRPRRASHRRHGVRPAPRSNTGRCSCRSPDPGTRLASPAQVAGSLRGADAVKARSGSGLHGRRRPADGAAHWRRNGPVPTARAPGCGWSATAPGALPKTSDAPFPGCASSSPTESVPSSRWERSRPS